MKRAVLVKMKNGRHRVASSGELRQMNRADDAIVEANNQRVRAFSAVSRLKSAREEAANEILKYKYLPDAVNELLSQLSYHYGPELMKHAEKLKGSDRQRRPWLNLSASFDPFKYKVMRIRGEIPAMFYEIAVPEF